MSNPPDFQLFSSLRYDPLLITLPVNTSTWETSASPSHGSPFYMLPYHRDRILQAAEHFGWTLAADRIRGSSGFAHLLEKLTEAIDTNSTVPLRVKMLISHDGSIAIETSPAVSVDQWNLYPSVLPPPPSAAQKLEISPLTGGILTLSSNDTITGHPHRSDPWPILLDTVKTPPSPYTSYKTTVRDMYTRAREHVSIKDVAEKKEVLLLSEKGREVMEGSLTTPFFWREGRWVTPGVESGGQIGTTRRWALEKGFCVEGVVTVDSLAEGEECWISNGVRGFQLGKVQLS